MLCRTSIALLICCCLPASATELDEAEELTVRQQGSYLLGWQLIQIAQRDGFASRLGAADLDYIQKGMAAALGQGAQLVDHNKASQILQRYRALVQQEHQRKVTDNRQAGEAYLQRKRQEEGVQATASGLLYEVLEAGSGQQPGSSDHVKVHYSGQLIDGTIFDSSRQHGGDAPTRFALPAVIKGWSEGIALMQEGARYRFHIPPDLAYGDGDQPGIGPGQVLVFDVELVEVIR